MKYTTAAERTFLRTHFASDCVARKLLTERTALRRALAKIANIGTRGGGGDAMTQTALDALEAK